MKTLKKALSLILALVIISALIQPAYAETATATTLRLAGSSGTVSITNSSGKEQTVKTDMRLYSGYSVSTEKQSSAYISLDGTKAVKLDASSKSSVRKAGNKLEVCLDSGKLFFDVTAPLAADESLNIRTSTMVTGIRGSFGWVARNEVALLHGHVTLTCINPVTGAVRVTELYSGERVYYDPDSTVAADPDLKEIDFIKEIITNDDIPAFVVEEIRKDESLQEALIEDVPSIDVPKLLEDYEEKKAAEDKEIEEREQELKEELKEQEKFIEEDPVDYLFDDEGVIATYSVQVLLPGSLVLTGALTSGDAITPTANADGSQTYDVPEGDSLTFTLNTTGFYVEGEVQVTLDGTELAAPYEVTAAGTVKALNVYYPLDSTTIDTLFDNLDTYGAVAFDDTTGTLTVSGNVKANQTLMITAGSIFTIGAGASLTIDEDGDLINKGTITNNGTFVNNSSHTFYNNAGATFQNWATATNNGRIVNDGTINNDGTMTFAGGSVTENGNTLQNNGGGGRTLTIEAGATVNNSGTVQNFDDFRNSGTINNTGTFNNTAGTFTNNGTFTAGGTALNGGTVTGQSGGITGTLYNGELTVTGTGAIGDDEIWTAFASSVVILDIDDGVTSIEDGAFQGYTALESVTIPATVTEIGENAFAGCTSLLTATFEGAMPDMGDGIFDGVDSEFALYYDYDQDGWYDKLGDDNTIGGYPAVSCARGNCGDDLYYTIYTAGKFDEDAGEEEEFIIEGVGDSVSAYRPNAEEDGTEEEEEAPLVWLEITGTGQMYDFDSYSDAPWYGQKIVQVVLPEELASIGNYAFYDCELLESIVIPDGVTYIGEYAFYKCEAMTTAILPNSLMYLGAYAFNGCKSLIAAAVPAGVTELNDGVFSGCSNLTSVVLQGEVTRIGKDALYGCRSLAHFDIPATVTSIDNTAFMYCSGLEELELPEGLQSLGHSAFMGCSSVKSFTLPENITDVPWQTFRECSDLIEVTFKGPITGIGNSAFAYCDKLPQLTIPGTVTSIGEEAFREAGLTSLVLPDSVTSVGKKAFVKCTEMKSITLSSSLTFIPDGLFDCCYKLETIVIPDGVTKIGNDSINGTTFANCRSLKELTLPAGLTRLGGPYTYQYCFTDDAKIIFKGTQAQWDSLKSAMSTKGNDRINSVTVVCLGG